MTIYTGTGIAMVVVGAVFVVCMRPAGIRERKGWGGVLAWGAQSALAVLIGSALGLFAVWLFGLVMPFLFHDIMGESRLWGVGFAMVVGGVIGVVMTVTSSLSINESFEDPAKVRRSRPPVRSRRKPRLP